MWYDSRGARTKLFSQMNTLGYTVLRIARSVGVNNRHMHLRAARRENILLTEAEDLLGQMAWPDVEEIEELAEEYWSLVELEGQKEKLYADIRALEDENQRLSEEHDLLEEDLDVQVEDLIDKKTEKMQKALREMHELETLRDKAEFTRKRFNGLKTKYKVLSDQGASADELNSVRADLEALKQRHTEESGLIEEKKRLIHGHEENALAVDDEIAKMREDAKGRISEMMSQVGKSSNLVAKHSAMIGSIDRQMKDLSLKVGQFLSEVSGDRRSSQDDDLRPVLMKHRQLLSKINALRKSVKYHRLLAGESADE